MVRPREKQWFSSNTNFVGLATNTQTEIQLFGASIHGARQIKGATLLRSIIDLRIQAQAVAQTVQLFWGLGIYTADARVAGGLSDPEDTSDRPNYVVRGKLTTIQSSLSDSSQWDRKELDIRTGRTLRSEEEELLMVLKNSAGPGGFALNFYMFGRFLMLMP